MRPIEKWKRVLNKLTVAATCYVVMEIAKDLRQRENTQDKASPRLDTTRDTFESLTSGFNAATFEGSFRMSLYSLLRILRRALQKNDEMGRRSGRATILPAIRLGITLRFMAGASVWDVITVFKLSKGMAYKSFHDTYEAINKKLLLGGLPNTEVELREAAELFTLSRSPPNPLSGCVASLDGIAFQIIKPSERYHPAAYWCRKGYYAVPVQAAVDSNYRFLCFSARCVGSTHDSLAHGVSRLGRYLEEVILRYQFWIAGDETYVCTEYLITPFPSSQRTDWQDAFNFWYSYLRMHVEQAFGC